MEGRREASFFPIYAESKAPWRREGKLCGDGEEVAPRRGPRAERPSAAEPERLKLLNPWFTERYFQRLSFVCLAREELIFLMDMERWVLASSRSRAGEGGRER